VGNKASFSHFLTLTALNLFAIGQLWARKAALFPPHSSKTSD